MGIHKFFLLILSSPLGLLKIQIPTFTTTIFLWGNTLYIFGTNILLWDFYSIVSVRKWQKKSTREQGEAEGERGIQADPEAAWMAEAHMAY